MNTVSAQCNPTNWRINSSFRRYRRVSRRARWRGDITYLRRHEEKNKQTTNSKLKGNQIDETNTTEGFSLQQILLEREETANKSLQQRCTDTRNGLYIDCFRQVHQGSFDRKRQHSGPDKVDKQDHPEVDRVLPPTFSVRRHIPILRSLHFSLHCEEQIRSQDR